MSDALETRKSDNQHGLQLNVKRLLWVDDDPHLAAGFERRLHRYGVELIHAFDGMQGYWMAASLKPDAIVTDLQMPNCPGEDLVECLRLNRQLSGIPTIVVSGHVTPPARKKLLQLGVEAVLEKPASLEDLLEELQKL